MLILIFALLSFPSIGAIVDPRTLSSRADRITDPYDLVEIAQELAEAGHLAAAVPVFRKALAAKGLPAEHRAQLTYNLAYAQHQAGDVAGALANYEAAGNAAGIPDAWIKAAQCAKELGHVARAVGFLQLAVRASAGKNPQVYQYLGDTLNNIKRFSEAETAYKEGLDVLRKVTGGRLDARSRELAVALQHGLGDTKLNRKDYFGAHEQYQAALRLQPENADLLASSWMCGADMAQWKDWENRTAKLIELSRQAVVELGKPSPLSPYAGLFLDLPHGLRKTIASSWSNRLVQQAIDAAGGRLSSAHDGASDGSVRRKLSLGYISRRFEDYPGTHLMLGMFKRHNRSRVTVHCYASGPDDKSASRNDVADGCDSFVDVSEMTPLATASLIRRDAVDVLIDYDGLHDFNNLETLALRPAASQATFLGFAGTTGQGAAALEALAPHKPEQTGTSANSPALDFMIVDRVTAPPELSASMFSEHMAYLPGVYQPQDPEQQIDGGFLPVPGPGVSGAEPSAASVRPWTSSRHALRLQESLPTSWRTFVSSLKDVSATCDAAAADHQVTTTAAAEGIDSDEPVVFTCFNRWHKIDPPIFASWMRILARTPGSILWLYGGSSDGPSTFHGTNSTVVAESTAGTGSECRVVSSAHADAMTNSSASGSGKSPPKAKLTDADKKLVHMRNLWSEAVAAGIHPSRIVFAGKALRDQHLKRHYAADVLLDTRIYGAHTTAADGLFTGLPVVTLEGSSFAARVGSALVHAAAKGSSSGYPAVDAASTVAHSHEEYEDIAVALGTNADLRMALRSQIAASIEASVAKNTAGSTSYSGATDAADTSTEPAALEAGPPALFDAVTFTTSFERAARVMAEVKQSFAAGRWLQLRDGREPTNHTAGAHVVVAPSRVPG